MGHKIVIHLKLLKRIITLNVCWPNNCIKKYIHSRIKTQNELVLIVIKGSLLVYWLSGLESSSAATSMFYITVASIKVSIVVNSSFY